MTEGIEQILGEGLKIQMGSVERRCLEERRIGEIDSDRSRG
jgi:hypothetical protein